LYNSATDLDGKGSGAFLEPIILTQWLLLAGIPQILLSGLVQEASKLAPVLFYWWRNKKSFTPQFGLIAGAVSGAGFGVFEAIWVHNQILPPAGVGRWSEPAVLRRFWILGNDSFR